MAKPASISIGITTFNRPDNCLRLLEDIKRDMGQNRLRVLVLDDCSTEDYKPVRQFLRAQGWGYYRADQNHGRRAWWGLVNILFERWNNDAADYFYFLQDDLRLAQDFFSKTIAVWQSMAQPDKVALYLHRDNHRDEVGVQCWTGFRSRVEGVVEKTQWIDCAGFLATRRFIDALEGRIHRIPTGRWKADPTKSSGVGEQISTRLHSKKLGMYRTLHSYVLHIDDTGSKMNAAVRDREPMHTMRFIDGSQVEAQVKEEYNFITASLATIPSRRESLKKVVARLLPQVDRLNVYLNETPAQPDVTDYPDIPKFLRHPKVTAVFSQDTSFGDMGDAGKFYWASEVRRGYHIICDDDVLYPPDFVQKLIAGVQRYKFKAAVGFHGAILTEPFEAYYGSRRTYHFSNRLEVDTPVHIVASNSLCYHTDTIQVSREDFKHPNMGDIWFGLLAQQQRVPLICLAHRKNWLVDDTSTRGDSIYAHSKGNKDSRKNTADVQTQVVKENMPWVVRNGDGKVILSIGEAPDVVAAAARERRRRKQEAASRKAAFLVASTNRPVLLAGVLLSLQNQIPVPGWTIEILVSGPANDPGRLIAELAGARYIPCEDPYPGHKINAMRRQTDAELLMLADDDDLQSPWRARASIEALEAGALWSSTSGFWCIDQATGKLAWWEGPPPLVGTAVSVRADVADKSDGWPARPEGKDGLFASRLRKVYPTAACADLVAQIGPTTLTIQHAQNIHRRRPFPDVNEEREWGKFRVTGRGLAQDYDLPKSLRQIVEGVLP